jgi:uncharacterized damage-inducible protein DinB
MTAGIYFAELLDYTAQETSRWKGWFVKNPGAFELAIDVAGTGTVRRLIQHIFFVELRFANTVLNLPLLDFDSIPAGSVNELFAVSEEAIGKYRQFLSIAKPEDWEDKVDLGPRLNFHPSKRKLVSQALTHSMRHWAQLATFLRQQGFKQDWVHDFLLSEAME